MLKRSDQKIEDIINNNYNKFSEHFDSWMNHTATLENISGAMDAEDWESLFDSVVLNIEYPYIDIASEIDEVHFEEYKLVVNSHNGKVGFSDEGDETPRLAYNFNFSERDEEELFDLYIRDLLDHFNRRCPVEVMSTLPSQILDIMESEGYISANYNEDDLYRMYEQSNNERFLSSDLKELFIF